MYSVRSSSCQLDGPSADFAVLGFERCMVAKARRLLAAPPRYVKQVKTDCLLAKEPAREPGGADQAAVRGRRTRLSGGGVLGRSAPPRMEAERPALRRWRFAARKKTQRNALSIHEQGPALGWQCSSSTRYAGTW